MRDPKSRCIWHLFQFILNGYRMEAFSKVSRKSFHFMDIWQIELWLCLKPFCLLWPVWASLDILSCLAGLAEFNPSQSLIRTHTHTHMHVLMQIAFKTAASWCVRRLYKRSPRPLALCSLSPSWLNPLPGITSVLLLGLRICAVWSPNHTLDETITVRPGSCSLRHCRCQSINRLRLLFEF